MNSLTDKKGNIWTAERIGKTIKVSCIGGIMVGTTIAISPFIVIATTSVGTTTSGLFAIIGVVGTAAEVIKWALSGIVGYGAGSIIKDLWNPVETVVRTAHWNKDRYLERKAADAYRKSQIEKRRQKRYIAEYIEYKSISQIRAEAKKEAAEHVEAIEKEMINEFDEMVPSST